ncbi:MAG: DUF4147 domain-containing protein [Gammaproteobacteria bacterium]|nr:DUF4147 domain-containing protein [Gammaproteobacteria bacterium]
MNWANAAPEIRRLLLDGLRAALDATGGRESVRRRLAGGEEFAPRFAFAVGKAAPAMMAGAFESLGSSIERALVVTKHGHAGDVLDSGWSVDVIESSHPVPDASSLAAGRALVDFVGAIPSDADALALISGGASALVEVLPEGFDASDLARVNEYLLAAGHPIGVVNRVRKRISRIKGGRLAQRLAARRTLSLAISDVPGDDPKVIGSGLLIAHSSDDISIDGFDLPSWLTEMGDRGPPLSDAGATSRVRTEVVARPADARAAAAATYRAAGMDVVEHRDLLEGDALDVGRRIGREVAGGNPGTRVWASETTVTLPPGPGRGGRCQSLALAAALEMRDCPGVWVLAAGTDGTDGPGIDAGAIVDAGTVSRGITAGLDPERSLRTADAGTFLDTSGDLVYTGPTGTNVLDLVVALKLTPA